MAHLLMTLAHDPTVQPVCTAISSALGPMALDLYAAFFIDSMAVVRSIPRLQVHIVAHHTSSLMGDQLNLDGATYWLRSDLRPTTIAQIAAELLPSGPVLICGADMPHLPLWRLRDALTHLEHSADVVIGHGEQGDWYLIGLRSAHPPLLRNLPAYQQSPTDFAGVAATHGFRVEHIPPWYTLNTLDDVARIAEDLRTMPFDVAPRTRRLLNGVGVQSRALGAS